MTTTKEEIAFDHWLRTRLRGLSLDDEAITDYVSSMIKEDNGESIEEKREAVADFLGAATEAPLDLFIRDCFEEWETARVARANAESGKAPVRMFMDEKATVSCTHSAAGSDKSSSTAPSKPVPAMSEEERIAREHAKAVAKAHYEEVEELPEAAGETIAVPVQASGRGRHKNKGQTLPDGGDPLMFRNMNAEMIQRAQQEQRETARKQHEAKVEQDKEQRQKDKERKEADANKRKQASQKQERRRM